jgi:hypothetical protein
MEILDISNQISGSGEEREKDNAETLSTLRSPEEEKSPPQR